MFVLHVFSSLKITTFLNMLKKILIFFQKKYIVYKKSIIFASGYEI